MTMIYIYILATVAQGTSSRDGAGIASWVMPSWHLTLCMKIAAAAACMKIAAQQAAAQQVAARSRPPRSR